MEAEDSTLKLPLFSMASPDHSGIPTPPLFTSATVPFRWEEEPGKPRPCTDIIPFSTIVESPRFLELPPRLLPEPSPTTVLEGPYVVSKPKFTSLRYPRGREREGRVSFDSSESAKGSPGRGQCKKLQKGTKGGIFGSWRYSIRNPKVCRGGKTREINPSSVFSMDSADDEGSISKRKVPMPRKGSSSSLSQATRSHFWATVYEGIKQVMPWKSRKPKKGLV